MVKPYCNELAKMTTKNWLHVCLMIGKAWAHSQMAKLVCKWLKIILSFSQIGHWEIEP